MIRGIRLFHPRILDSRVLCRYFFFSAIDSDLYHRLTPWRPSRLSMPLIYSSISPILLSIFVIYPWALALVVWQYSARDAKCAESETPRERSVEIRPYLTLLSGREGMDQKSGDVSPAFSAECARVSAILSKLQTVPTDPDFPFSSRCCLSIRIPRSPPSFFS